MYKKLKKSLGHNYAISRFFHDRRLRVESKKSGDPILVFQMGKVASTTIVGGLHKSLPESPVFHVHFLSDDGLYDAKMRLRKLVRRFNANAWCLYESEYVRNYLEKYDVTRKIKVITLFREPIARNISSFFYNVNKYVPEFSGYKLEDSSWVAELQNKYLNVFEEHEYSLQWFDKELLPVFGVDLFQYEFDLDKGYSIIKNGRVEVLVLKLEKLKECAPVAFKEFLNIHDYKLDMANTSDEQSYYQFYKKFLEGVELPKAYIDKMYESRYMKKLYSEEELFHYRERWSRSE